jgi:hypothetical protein
MKNVSESTDSPYMLWHLQVSKLWIFCNCKFINSTYNNVIQLSAAPPWCWLNLLCLMYAFLRFLTSFTYSYCMKCFFTALSCLIQYFVIKHFILTAQHGCCRNHVIMVEGGINRNDVSIIWMHLVCGEWRMKVYEVQFIQLQSIISWDYGMLCTQNPIIMMSLLAVHMCGFLIYRLWFCMLLITVTKHSWRSEIQICICTTISHNLLRSSDGDPMCFGRRSRIDPFY